MLIESKLVVNIEAQNRIFETTPIASAQNCSSPFLDIPIYS